MDSAGNVALLLASGQVCQLVTLDKELNVQYSGNVTTSNKVVRRGELVYLLTDSTVESLTSAGEYQWSQSLTARPQALLADAKQTLVFLRQHGAAGNGTGNLLGKLRKKERIIPEISTLRQKVTGKILYVQESVISFLISYARWFGCCWPSATPAKAFWPRWCSWRGACSA